MASAFFQFFHNLTHVVLDSILNLVLDKFGVDNHKDPVILREFVGQTEDWENELKKNYCPVVEARFSTKYKNLLFLFEDNNKVYTIFEGNMEFH